MSPRPYRLGQRQAATDQTRSRILATAREVLASDDFAGFSIDTLARQAGVARMTVYYQFKSKAGLLEALFDYLAAAGGMDQAGAAFGQPEPVEALAEYIALLCHFFASERLVFHRLRGLAILDPDLERALADREEFRRNGLRVILGRIADTHSRPAPALFDETLAVIHALTSFETFNTLTANGRTPQDIGRLVHRLALATLDL
jgi:AcrR family transcriptional regulator